MNFLTDAQLDHLNQIEVIPFDGPPTVVCHLDGAVLPDDSWFTRERHVRTETRAAA